MRYGSEHKAETRQRILDIASRRFREEGVDAVGVASLMADAGLTHGGFYAHFKSKEELVAAAVGTALAESHSRIKRIADSAENGIETYIDAYLSPAHRDAVADGCCFAALGADLSRHEDPARAVMDGELDPYLSWIGTLLPATDPASVRRQSAALFSLLMGTLQLARLATDREQSDSILDSGRKAALQLISVFQGV